MHVASYKVLAYCNKPKVGINLYKLAISFQNTACFLTFCSSGQSLLLFQNFFLNILVSLLFKPSMRWPARLVS